MPWDNRAFFVRILPNKGGFFISRSKKIGIISLSILIICLLGTFFAYRFLAPKPVVGSKTITISIDHMDGEDKTLKISTAAEFLSGALEQEGLIEGTEGQYGFYVTSLDGETADESKQQWWGFTKLGMYVDTAVNQTIIEDGDSFEFTLNEGW